MDKTVHSHSLGVGFAQKDFKDIYLLSECCSSPPLTNTDVHDGIAICDECREWSGFYKEDEPEYSEEALNGLQ